MAMTRALVLAVALFACLVALPAEVGAPPIAGPALALCGGGEPGEPCYCPQPPYPLNKLVAINC